MSNPKFEVIPHPYSQGHVLFKVTDSGRVWACAAATVESKPNRNTVQYHWKHQRQDFLPYNEATGAYCS